LLLEQDVNAEFDFDNITFLTTITGFISTDKLNPKIQNDKIIYKSLVV